MQFILKTFAIFGLIFFSSTLIAQKNVVLQINHFLGENPFAFSEKKQNNLEHDFDVTRLEYYLSNISVIHDGGQETTIDDLYVLVKASNETIIPLGELDIDVIEGISFHVGVDADHNHLDPASWSSDHPLYPKFPTMHWGWAAGYRFLVIEGNAGPNVNNLYQLHCLGDENYFKTSVMNSAVEDDGFQFIYVDADYVKGLEDISISSGVISHGAVGEAKSALENFRDFVFTPGSAPSGLFSNLTLTDLEIHPNPVSNELIQLSNISSSYNTLKIFDTNGVLVFGLTLNGADSQAVSLENLSNGVYYLRMEGQQSISAVSKLIKI